MQIATLFLEKFALFLQIFYYENNSTFCDEVLLSGKTKKNILSVVC